MKKSCQFSLAVSALAALLITGCESIDTSLFGGSFGRNSTAMTAGGAVAGQDYVIGLKPSEAAQQYFASASASDAKTVTVTPGDDKGTGVTWTDDGGITIPPGVTIEFVNKGYCLDPHLPAPKADEEMQFIKTSCLIPTQLQGTYKNLLRRAAAGDEDVKSNLQHLMWTLRTAGSNDAYAKNLTDRQREILAECAEAGSFDGYCQDLHRFDELKKLAMAQVGQVTDKLQVEIGNVTYKVSDLLDPELGKQKVAAHLGELIHMNEYLPVVHSGFNFGELQKGIYTDIKGNGTLSFKAKVANSTSEPFVFYPMDYVAQVGSGQNMQGAFFAAADSTMRQRTTNGEHNKVEVEEVKKPCNHVWSVAKVPGDEYQKRRGLRKEFQNDIDSARQDLINRFRETITDDGLEHGALIYYEEGVIKVSDFIDGNRDWEVRLMWPMGMLTDYVQRITMRNGKYYAYKGHTGEIEKEVPSMYGDYANNIWYTVEESGSFSPGDVISGVMRNHPNAIPLEIVHSHPGNRLLGKVGNGFSGSDILFADEMGVNISVIYKDWSSLYNDETYYPDGNGQYSSFSEGKKKGHLDDSVSDELLRKIMRYRCKKCGAIR